MESDGTDALAVEDEEEADKLDDDAEEEEEEEGRRVGLDAVFPETDTKDEAWAENEAAADKDGEDDDNDDAASVET